MLKTKVINTHTNDVYQAELSPRSIQQAECLIGRHPNCDLVLDGPAVSRVHGRVLFEAGQCFFTDLGSTDGSRLNNEETHVNESYEIAPDDVLRIGEFALIVEALSPVTSTTETTKTWAGEEITARCVQILQETPDVKTFRFVAEPEQLFDFKPGQFAMLKLPIDAEGKPVNTLGNRPVTRAYSISSSPSRPYTLDITVKRVGPAGPDLPPGLVSNWLHDSFEVGMTLPIQGPLGDFNCIDHPADKLLLISAGSGITPMMSMAQWLSDRAANSDMTFIHAARTAEDIIFRQRLELLAAQHPNFKLALTLTADPAKIPLSQPWAGYRGRLNPALLTAICPDFAARTVFVCGPGGFMRATKALLAEAGFPMENYFEESFGGPTASPKAKTTAQDKTAVQDKMPTKPETDGLSLQTLAQSTPSVLAEQSTQSRDMTQAGALPGREGGAMVEFSVSGQTVVCDDEDTLLDAAEQAGVSLSSGCRMGSCGVCKHRLAAGEVAYDVTPQGLSESDRNTGYVLACVAKPVGKVVLAL